MAKRMRSAFSRLLERHWANDDSSEDDWCRTDEGRSVRRPPQRRFVVHSDDSTEMSDLGSDEDTASQSGIDDDESNSEADYDSGHSWASDAPVRSAPTARNSSRPQRQARSKAMMALAQACREEMDEDETEEEEEEEEEETQPPPAKRRNVVLSDEEEDDKSAEGTDGDEPAEAPLEPTPVVRAAPQPRQEVVSQPMPAQVQMQRQMPPMQMTMALQPEMSKLLEVPRPELPVPPREMLDPFRVSAPRLEPPQPFWEQPRPHVIPPVRMPMQAPMQPQMGMQHSHPEPPPMPWRMPRLESPMAREAQAIPRPSYVPARPPPPVPSSAAPPPFFAQYGSGALSRLQSMTESLPGGDQRQNPMVGYFPQQQQQQQPQPQQHPQQHLQHPQHPHPQQQQQQQPQQQQPQPFWGASQPYWQAQYPPTQYGPPPGYFAPNFGMAAAGQNEQPRHTVATDSKVYQQL